MKLSRLALPLAALAAVFGMSIAAAEDNPVREFLMQEAKIEQPEANVPANTQLANAAATTAGTCRHHECNDLTRRGRTLDRRQR